jgi:hypothetical protein
MTHIHRARSVPAEFLTQSTYGRGALGMKSQRNERKFATELYEISPEKTVKFPGRLRILFFGRLKSWIERIVRLKRKCLWERTQPILISWHLYVYGWDSVEKFTKSPSILHVTLFDTPENRVITSGLTLASAYTSFLGHPTHQRRAFNLATM